MPDCRIRVHPLQAAAVILVLLTATLFATPPASAQVAPEGCQSVITLLPAVLKSARHYCFSRDLKVAATFKGRAPITIDADFVTLDLGGFRLDGSAVPATTEIIGILVASNRSHVLIRHGTVRGFTSGIRDDGGGSDVGVEDITADANRSSGIDMSFSGPAAFVRNCRVTFLAPPAENTYGIVLGTSGGGLVQNNSVIGASDTAIIASGALVEHNRIYGGVAGIVISSNSGVCRDNLVENTSTPYTNCTNVGTSNYP